MHALKKEKEEEKDLLKNLLKVKCVSLRDRDGGTVTFGKCPS